LPGAAWRKIEITVVVDIHERRQSVVANALVRDGQLAADEMMAELEVRSEQLAFTDNAEAEEP